MRLLLLACLALLPALYAADEQTNSGTNINSTGCRCLVDAPLKVCAGRPFQMTVNLLSATAIDKDFTIELKGTADAHFDGANGPKTKIQRPCPSVGVYTVWPGADGGRKIEVWVGTSLCKEIEVVKVDLFPKSATFAGPIHNVSRDDIQGAPAYTTPHWLDNNDDADAADDQEHRFPVCYTRGATPRLGATFRVRLPSGQQFPEVRVRGSGPDGIIFPDRVVTYANGIATYPETAAEQPLPNTIRFYNPFTVQWEMQCDPSTGWQPIGTTDNRMYVTLADPKVTRLFETVAELSCGAADGVGEPDPAITAIWGVFASRNVHKKPLNGYNQPDGHLLTYYGTPSPFITQNVTTTRLLLEHDGQCGAWVDIFLDSLEVQGIKQAGWSRSFEVKPNPEPALSANGFFIKNHSFAMNVNPVNYYGYENWGESPNMSNGAWLYAEVTRIPGIPGQGVDTPNYSFFEIHYAARIVVGGVPAYYDPSYGIKVASSDELEAALIEGFYQYGIITLSEQYFNVDNNGDGDLDDEMDRFLLKMRRNEAGSDLIETPGN